MISVKTVDPSNGHILKANLSWSQLERNFAS